MPLLKQYGGFVITEKEMQNKVIEFLSAYEFQYMKDSYYHDLPKPEIYTELHIPEINRRSDILLYFIPTFFKDPYDDDYTTRARLVNIECKLTDAQGVIDQAVDYLAFVDYSYVLLPFSGYIPNYRIVEMVEKGIGLLFWEKETEKIYELIYAKYNPKRTKEVRDSVIQMLDRKRALKNAEELHKEYLKTQTVINFVK